MPGFRFYCLVMAWLKLDKVDEDVAKLDMALDEADFIEHPFKTNLVNPLAKRIADKKLTHEELVEEDGFDELPVEVRKKLEFELRAQEDSGIKNKFRVPEWWQGEKAAYQNAKTAMGSVPKNIGEKIRE